MHAHPKTSLDCYLESSLHTLLSSGYYCLCGVALHLPVSSDLETLVTEWAGYT